ncbi:MAG: Gfo/Idh/MocA family oxidoreductase [Gemmatimonadota bacterium]|nr:Gfo/Idh/MocA family oxidoreductase [Gemmatimonadota bacterium]
MSATHPRIGVAGVGSLGYHHARIISSLEGVNAAGVFDVRMDRGEEVAEAFGIPCFPSLEALLDVSDGLVVAVPTSEHEAVARAGLERGVHVLVEKPLAGTLESADRILAAAERGGAVVQVGHVERFNSALVRAWEHLDRPLFIESHRMAPFSARSTDVAVVLDLMIHDVDLVMRIVGKPILEVAAVGVPVLSENVDIANARLTFEGGGVANLTASRVSLERMRKLRIFQRSGYMSLDLAQGSGEFLRLRDELPGLSGERPGSGIRAENLGDIVERISLVGNGGEPLARELESFRDAITNGRIPSVSGHEGREALAVTLVIQERIEAHVIDARTP